MNCPTNLLETVPTGTVSIFYGKLKNIFEGLNIATSTPNDINKSSEDFEIQNLCIKL